MISLACNFAAGKLCLQHMVLRTTPNPVNYLQASYYLKYLSFSIFKNTGVGDSFLLSYQPYPFQTRSKQRHKNRETVKYRKENEGEKLKAQTFVCITSNFKWWIKLEFWQPWIFFSYRLLHGFPSHASSAVSVFILHFRYMFMSIDLNIFSFCMYLYALCACAF